MVALLAAAPGRAADPPQGPSNSSADNRDHAPTDPAATRSAPEEEIVVTAEKRQQTLIDVPAAVSVVSGATLATQEARTFQDYLNQVPGLQLNQDTPGQGRLIIRGLNTGGVASTVAVYVDETPFGSSSGLANGAILAGDFDTFDVSRVEVLKGPQGTLYGASSLGGVLKFVTNAPDPAKFSLRARTGVEGVDGGGTGFFEDAVVNVPLAPTLAVRASGFYRRDAGFIDSIGTAGSRVAKDVNADRSYGGRASVLWTPDPRVSIRLSAILQNIDTAAPSVVDSSADTLQTLYGRPTQSVFVPPLRDVKYRLYNGTGSFDLGFAELTSVTSYATQKQPSRTDETFALSGLIETALGVPNQLYQAQDTNLRKWTQEVRLSSSGGRLLDWVVGAYYTHEHGLIFQQYVPVTPGTLDPITSLPSLALANLSSTYQEIAGFANATVHLGERIDIDLGGRESHNSQHADEDLSGALVGPATTFVQHSHENVFTYSVAPKLKLGRDAAIYLRVAKGFRPGGPNALGPGAPAGSETYRSDTVTNYEAGFKGETPDHSFAIDISGFHIDWHNIQLLTSVTTDAGPFNFNANGGKARSDGVEFTVTVRPTAGLDLSVNGSYNHAYLTEAAPAAVGGLAGDELPYTPKITVNLNGTYTWRLFGQTDAFVGGTLRSLGNQSGEFDAAYRTANGRQRRVPAYETVDLRAGLDVGRVQLEAYVRNLLNADGKLSNTIVGVYPNGAVGAGVIRPRSIGASATVAF